MATAAVCVCLAGSGRAALLGRGGRVRVGGARCGARRAAAAPRVRAGLFDNFGKSTESAKDDEFRRQQEVLRARRSGKAIEAAQKRRAAVQQFVSDPEVKKRGKVSRQAFEGKKKEVYSEEDNKLGGIIIPLAPFDIPEFDNGERWDLKAGYADEGWEDEDADVMKKIRNFFGGGKK